ncbi:hypothetical protein RHMOL_Rhmol10G0087100 [Rhododendron molle]|uniref:Uncharacterized protein n=1 Tax=Rhododendron molle TaxID=49168 RepID=A0ACC0M031_RHOML|nr:hypothetical protein RHMOL_Rhmol10G0087100 [Rhododendron molle]
MFIGYILVKDTGFDDLYPMNRIFFRIEVLINFYGVMGWLNGANCFRAPCVSGIK